MSNSCSNASSLLHDTPTDLASVVRSWNSTHAGTRLRLRRVHLAVKADIREMVSNPLLSCYEADSVSTAFGGRRNEVLQTEEFQSLWSEQTQQSQHRGWVSCLLCLLLHWCLSSWNMCLLHIWLQNKTLYHSEILSQSGSLCYDTLGG